MKIRGYCLIAALFLAALLTVFHQDPTAGSAAGQPDDCQCSTSLFLSANDSIQVNSQAQNNAYRVPGPALHGPTAVQVVVGLAGLLFGTLALCPLFTDISYLDRCGVSSHRQ